MSTTLHASNITYTEFLKRPLTTKGTVIINNGTSNFELVTPTSNGQILVSDTGTSAGAKWSSATQGLGVGFGIPNGITPTQGNTNYFLVESSSLYVPAIPVPNGTIIFFSVRPDNSGAGWTNNPSSVTGGTLDYTFGYIGATADPAVSAGNFIDYAGGPHFQVTGTSINSTGTNFTSFYTDLNIPITVTGQQLCVKLTNNWIYSGTGPTTITQQNAFIILRH